MRAITLEWVEKAEKDWNSLHREVRARKNPNYDAACFFAQQCVEKYLKARLVEADIYFNLTDYAIDVRYPGLQQILKSRNLLKRFAKVFVLRRDKV